MIDKIDFPQFPNSINFISKYVRSRALCATFLCEKNSEASSYPLIFNSTNMETAKLSRRMKTSCWNSTQNQQIANRVFLQHGKNKNSQSLPTPTISFLSLATSSLVTRINSRRSWKSIIADSPFDPCTTKPVK